MNGSRDKLTEPPVMFEIVESATGYICRVVGEVAESPFASMYGAGATGASAKRALIDRLHRKVPHAVFRLELRK